MGCEGMTGKGRKKKTKRKARNKKRIIEKRKELEINE